MNRPAHLSTIQPPELFSPRRLAIIGLVAALHVLLVYAIITGLANRIVLETQHVLNVDIRPQPEVEHNVPPPQPKLLKPTPPTVAPPVIKIANPPAARTSIAVVPRPVAPPEPVAPPQPRVVPPPPPKPAPTPPRSIAATHTIPPYPDIARRLNEEGTVQLAISVDPDGRVSNVQVLQSSGSDRLDKAATEWVTSHWRYRPATQDGKPIASSVRAAVVFNLKNAF